MNYLLKTFVLAVSAMLLSNTINAQCSTGCTYTSSGGSGNFNLNGNQTLCIQSGNFTGNINFSGSGNTICIGPNATFTPGNLNNANGITINNYGTFNDSNAFSFGAGTTINNYKTLQQQANFNFNGAVSMVNHNNAVWNVTPNFILQNNSTFVNNGTLNAVNELSTNTGTSFTNNNRIRIGKNFNPSGTFNNYGFLSAEGFINFNSGSMVTNYCTFFSKDGFNNNSGNTRNFGLIWVTSNNAQVQNNAAYFQGAGALTRGERYINSSTVTGSGSYYFTKNTVNQGPFGNDGQGINFYDASGSSKKIFDVENTVPHSSVTSLAFIPNDTTVVWAGCSNNFPAPVAIDSTIQSVKNSKVKVPVTAIAKDNISGLNIARTNINPNAAIHSPVFVDTGKGVYTYIPTGEIEFVPDSGFIGVSEMSYYVVNNIGFRSNIASVTITVEDPSVLPVALLYFKGERTDASVELEWATASEINNDYFEVERSTDGKSFETLTNISGAGNSNRKLYYTFTDENPGSGLMYYRLRQVDYDGQQSFSRIILIDAQENNTLLRTFPNPANDYIRIVSQQPVREIQLMSMNGQVMIRRSFDQETTDIETDVRGYTPGVYLIQIILQDNSSTVSKVIVR